MQSDKLLHCPFECLAVAGIGLECPTADYDDWFVVFKTHADDGLFARTNAEALVAALQKVHGTDAAELLEGWRGEKVAVVNPSNYPALLLAAAYAAAMDNGQHIDLLAYHTAQRERCAERWAEMTIADRIAMLQAHNAPVAAAVHGDVVPASIAASLFEMFE